MTTRNRTLSLSENEIKSLSADLTHVNSSVSFDEIADKVICEDMLRVAEFLPNSFVDVLFLDPPYNMNKRFNGKPFEKREIEDYNSILDKWIRAILHTLKPSASIYICGDWHTSVSIHTIASKYFIVRNRITWEREKGRGAMSNWKNSSEDIWFLTFSDDYYYNVDAVKLKKKVVAPYRNNDGSARDWESDSKGNFRLTSPSNLWTDITVPFWSMPENTDHPTQKPEKLLAKIILASSKPGDVILDPFLGSGTTAVVANKLGRTYVGIEQEERYACYALQRLIAAKANRDIQGYSGGVFWERNSLSEQKAVKQLLENRADFFEVLDDRRRAE